MLLPRSLPPDWHHTVDLDLLDQVTNLARARLLLDLGAGPYDISTQLLARHPGLRVIALEMAPLPPPPDPRLAGVRADARQIPLRVDTVDLSYARFLLQHVPNPALVLDGMKRVTRPGGAVAVLEVDEGAILMHPQPPEVRRTARAYIDNLRAQGKDRHLGRRLRHLLIQAGLKQVGLQAIPITTEQVGMDAFWSIVMTRRGSSARVPEWARVPGAFGCIVLFLAWGEVS